MAFATALPPSLLSFLISHLPQLVFMPLSSKSTGGRPGERREEMELAVGDCEKVEDDGEGGYGRHAHRDLGTARRRAGHQLIDAVEEKAKVEGCV